MTAMVDFYYCGEDDASQCGTRVACFVRVVVFRFLEDADALPFFRSRFKERAMTSSPDQFLRKQARAAPRSWPSSAPRCTRPESSFPCFECRLAWEGRSCRSRLVRSWSFNFDSMSNFWRSLPQPCFFQRQLPAAAASPPPPAADEPLVFICLLQQLSSCHALQRCRETPPTQTDSRFKV